MIEVERLNRKLARIVTALNGTQHWKLKHHPTFVIFLWKEKYSTYRRGFWVKLLVVDGQRHL
jgi:hypothetical protein